MVRVELVKGRELGGWAGTRLHKALGVCSDRKGKPVESPGQGPSPSDMKSAPWTAVWRMHCGGRGGSRKRRRVARGATKGEGKERI